LDDPCRGVAESVADAVAGGRDAATVGRPGSGIPGSCAVLTVVSKASLNLTQFRGQKSRGERRLRPVRPSPVSLLLRPAGAVVAALAVAGAGA
jgi:hypothetical protein